VFFKMGRWDPAKGWLPAVEAMAALKASGHRVRFLVRGGVEPYGGDVLRVARNMGLTVAEVNCGSSDIDDQLRVLAGTGDADVLDIRFFIRPQLARLLYASADCVLANSSHEPFGLVGLEAMAAGGIAYTGSTGEEYARSMENAVVLETFDAAEIASYASYLHARPDRQDRMRQMARITAESFTWENIIENELLPKLEFYFWRKGLSEMAGEQVVVPADTSTHPSDERRVTEDRPGRSGQRPLVGVKVA